MQPVQACSLSHPGVLSEPQLNSFEALGSHCLNAEASLMIAHRRSLCFSIFFSPKFKPAVSPVSNQTLSPANPSHVPCRAVQTQQWQEAITSYTDAITACADAPPVFAAVLHSNRAAAYQGLEQYTDAVADSLRAKALDPSYAKVPVSCHL